jgi:osmotically-inducible protein OsmY
MTVPRPPKSDHEIQSEVLVELNRDRRLTPAEVGVEVCGGIVTLTGTVSSLGEGRRGRRDQRRRRA